MDRIGRYAVLEKLMSTGFSDIYIGKDPGVPGHLAIKVFHPKGDNVGEKARYGAAFWRERFIEEARLLAEIDHPHVVDVTDVAELPDGTPYFVMPFIQANLLIEIGEDAADAKAVAALPEKWRPRAISPRRAVTIWRQILSALSALHERDLVHRDIKPQNILLTAHSGGDVRLCDFGMVKVPGAQGSRAGIWIGTLDYISPEQRRSAADVDARSDLYSAAVLMYRMLTGGLPARRRVPLRPGRFGIPGALVDVIEACLEVRRRDRPADASAVIAAVDAAVPDVEMLAADSRILRRSRAARRVGGPKAHITHIKTVK